MSDGSVLTGTPAAAPAAAAPAPTPNPTATAPATASWDAALDDATKGWASSRGYKLDDPAEVAKHALQGHYNAEKLIGLDRAGRTVVLPKDDASPEELSQFYGKIGRPPSPAEYQLPEALKGDPVATAFAEAAHSQGYTQKQFSQALEFVTAKAEELQAAQQAEIEAKNAAALEGLRKEWGQEFELRSEAAKRAVRELGLQGEGAMALEQALGVDRAAKVMFEIGKRLLEPQAEGMTGGTSRFGPSPAEAQARIAALRKDDEFQKRYAKGDAAARAEWDRLSQVAFS